MRGFKLFSSFLISFLVGVASSAILAADAPKSAPKPPPGKARAPDSDEVEIEDDFNVSTQAADGEGASAPELVTLLSWKFKKNPAQNDFDRQASVIATADIAVLQNVEFNERGETNLSVIANLLEKRLNERVCRAWFKNGKGQRGRLGFLWRERLFAYVDRKGEMHEDCSPRPFIIRWEAKDTGPAMFFFKPNRRLLVIQSVDMESTPKKPEKELPSLFRTHSDTDLPVVFAGDFKTSVKSNGFKDPRKWNFKPALNGKRKRTDNFWFKNMAVVGAEPVNLYELFPDIDRSTVNQTVSDSAPLRAEFSFSEKEAEVMQTQMLSKKKAAKATPDTALVLKGPSYPAPVDTEEMSSFKEDLESEAQSTEPPVKSSPAKKSGKKKKRK